MNLPVTSSGDNVEASYSASDIIVPRLHLLQQMSQAVAKGHASPGDIVRSNEDGAFAKRNESVEVIPIKLQKSWKIMRARQKGDTKGEYVGHTPYAPGEDESVREWTEDGVAHWRDRQLSVFCLLPSDIAAETKALKAIEESGELPDFLPSTLPTVVTFQRSSYLVGKTFATHFAQCVDISGKVKRHVPPYSYTFVLDRDFIEGENNYFVWTAKVGRRATDEEREKAGHWAAQLETKQVKVEGPEDE